MRLGGIIYSPMYTINKFKLIENCMVSCDSKNRLTEGGTYMKMEQLDCFKLEEGIDGKNIWDMFVKIYNWLLWL